MSRTILAAGLAAVFAAQTAGAQAASAHRAHAHAGATTAKPAHREASSVPPAIRPPNAIEKATLAAYFEQINQAKADGDLDKALILLQSRLTLEEKTWGPAHPVTAETLGWIAWVYERQEKNALAEPLLRRILDIRRAAFGENDHDTARAYDALGLNLLYQQRPAAAEVELRKALAIRQAVKGAPALDRAEGDMNLAIALVMQGRFGDAEPFIRSGLDGRRAALGETHPDTLEAWSLLAHDLEAQGRKDEAAQATRRLEALTKGRDS